MFGGSLAARVVAYLIFAQFTASILALLISYGLGFAHLLNYELSLDSLAVSRANDLVYESLTRDADGVLRIVPSQALRAEMQRAPKLKFAAFDHAFEALPGSSPELARVLAGAIKVNSSHTHFTLPEDPRSTPRGYAEPRKTPFGELQIAVYGQRFRWDDIFYYIADEFRWSAVNIFTAILVSIGAAWFAVRQALEPLRSVSLEAARIDFDSFDQHLTSEQLPTEIMPLVVAMNDALDRLYASARRLRRYTANAAHELRTPLAIMRARLEDWEEPTFKADLLRDASHLQAIVEQMLIAARLSEGQVSLNEEVDLVATVRVVVSRYLPLAVKCERDLVFEAARGAIITRGNRRAIECVVANLIDNALRAEPPHGAVLVRLKEPATIEISDHGRGVEPGDRNTIFEPFWRKDDASSGSGLGLAIAKELVERHGARIWVEDTCGGGATFTVAFPADSAAQGAAEFGAQAVG